MIETVRDRLARTLAPPASRSFALLLGVKVKHLYIARGSTAQHRDVLFLDLADLDVGLHFERQTPHREERRKLAGLGIRAAGTTGAPRAPGPAGGGRPRKMTRS